MKNFFSTFFASLTALVVFSVGCCLVLVLFIAALAAMGGAAMEGNDKPVAVSKGSYLVVDLSVNVQDKPEQMEGFAEIAEAFGGEGDHLLQLRQATRALRAAALDSDIAGIYLHGNFRPMGYGSGYAALKELREALGVFKATGKPIKAYLTNASTRDYFIASVASELTIDPYGMIFMPGLASQPMFLTGAFEKLGLGMQVTRVGKYKSAVEPFTRKDMSPESRAQTTKLLGDLWAEIVTTVEQARGMKPGTLQPSVDSDGFMRAELAQQLKIVDRAANLDVVLDELKVATGRKGAKTFKQIALKDYAKLIGGDGLVGKRQEHGKIELGASSAGKVAIVYAEGEIVDGDGHEPDYVWGQKLAKQIREIRQDSSVKALVLRVNSPGGSVTASEAILRELSLMQKEKTVVVSMGTVAASGGYWISTAAERIFAEPNTITGSIGVFGMFLNVQGLAQDKMGLTFDVVKTGKFADASTIVRPKTDEELAFFQKSVDWIYEEFIGKVAAARKLDKSVVHEIAQGRVWSGTEAMKLGLVDEMGGLDAATQYAATKAGLGEKFRVVEYPRKKQFAEMFAEAFDKGRREYSGSAGPLGALLRQTASELKTLQQLNDPQGVYARLPFDLGMN
jgi:protease-4